MCRELLEADIDNCILAFLQAVTVRRKAMMQLFMPVPLVCFSPGHQGILVSLFATELG